MSYELKISPKDRAAGRLIGKARKGLIQAALEEKAASGISQNIIAQKLGVHRSVINRLLRGNSNLTLRTIAEIAWAIGWDADIVFTRRSAKASRNHFTETMAPNAANLLQPKAFPGSSTSVNKAFTVTASKSQRAA